MPVFTLKHDSEAYYVILGRIQRTLHHGLSSRITVNLIGENTATQIICMCHTPIKTILIRLYLAIMLPKQQSSCCLRFRLTSYSAL